MIFEVQSWFARVGLPHTTFYERMRVCKGRGGGLC